MHYTGKTNMAYDKIAPDLTVHYTANKSNKYHVLKIMA